MDIGERIRSLREGLNMTQTELAIKVGYSSKTAINKIENGTNKLRQEKIAVFAKVLNVDPYYLLGLDEPQDEPNDSVVMNIGSRIKQCRESLGMSQDELAKRLGYKSRSSINKIEIGRNNISSSKIEEFANALGIPPSELMGWKSQSYRNEITEVFDKLTNDNKQKVLELAKMFLSSQQ